jgi:hypothetical protein
MADLDDLGYTSILDMSNDEAIDALRQIRLSRKMQKKAPTKTVKAKLTVNVDVDADLAAKLLKTLGG